MDEPALLPLVLLPLVDLIILAGVHLHLIANLLIPNILDNPLTVQLTEPCLLVPQITPLIQRVDR